VTGVQKEMKALGKVVKKLDNHAEPTGQDLKTD
jgi:hypothetical protein